MATIAKGSKSVLAWKTEGTLGTAPSGNWNQLPLNSETLDENIETIQGEDIRSDRRNPALRGGNIATGGQIIHDFGPNRTMTFLRHLLAASSVVTAGYTPLALDDVNYVRGDYALNAGGDLFVCLQGGAVTLGEVGGLDAVTNGDTSLTNTKWRYVADTGSVPTLYTHTITAAIDLPSVGLSFEKAILGGTVAQHVQFTGGRVNTLDLAVQQQGVVKATWGMLFSGSANLGASAGYGIPTIASEDPFSGFDALIHLADAGFVGGSAQTGRGIHREFSLNITNNIQEDVYTIGSRFRTDLPEGRRQGSGRMSLYFIDGTEYAYFKNETELSIGLSLIHQGNFMIFKFPETKITGSGTPKISGQGVMMADFDWTAYYQDGGGNFDMEVVVRNAQATPIV